MVQATLVAAIAAAFQFASPALLSAEESGRPALMIEIDGAIGPATARYVKEALTTAGERRVDVVILRLNTPGGLATSMREIIADVLGSSVPVIGYVAPSGAHAASAGTYILYATHIAAMAPGTNLGAATPVQIGGPLPGLPGSAPDKDGKDKKDEAQQPALNYLSYLLLVVVVVMFLSAAIRILREYERGIVFTLGRFTGVKGPGLIILIPFVQQMVKVDLRVVVQDVPPQDVITRDNVTVKVNAVLYFRIIDPERAIIKVADFMAATSQLAQTTLRSVLGKHELDELLAERDRLNADIQEILDQQTDAWGIKVTNVEIKHVDLNESMIRAIAKQAEAERLRRAKVINAEGEQQAAEKLVEAGRLLGREPQAMQLRYFAALHDIASERSSTIVFPLPTDLLTHLTHFAPRPDGAK